MDCICVSPQLTTRCVKEKTRYIKQDKNGHLVLGTWINKKPEDEWYNYTNRKWANIVVTDGEVKDGKIEGATKTSYFVWIPNTRSILLKR